MSIDYQKLGDGVAHVLLNRPDRLNALDRAAKEELARIWSDAGADPAVRAVVISGAGERAFSSGSDLKEMQGNSAMVPTEVLLAAIPCVGTPIDKPVLAACHGYTIGTGLTLAMHCDIRLAARGTQFGFPDTPKGMIAGISALTLPRLIGHGPAMEIMLSGRLFDAEEALALHLISEIVDGSVLEATMTRAARLASYPDVAVAASKRLMTLEMRAQVRTYYEEVVQARLAVQHAKFAAGPGD
jgi:enoyl-CoA hydratase